MTTRKKLTPEEQAAARRLRAIWERKKGLLGLTQETAADRCGWTQGAFFQYLDGKIALNIEALLKISNVLVADPREIYPELVESLTPFSTLQEERPEYGKNMELGTLSKDEEALLRKYRHLKSKERTQLQAVIDALASTLKRDKKQA